MTDAGALGTACGRPWWVRLRAALATGLVLGTGATTTLAAWTDQTVVTGKFSTATFTVEANPSMPFEEGTPWISNPHEEAVLQLDADGLTPGATSYAALALRTTTDSIGGTAVLQGADIGTNSDPLLAETLRYRVVSAPSCDADAFTTDATYLVGGPQAPAPLTTGQDPLEPVTLPEGEADTAGQAVHLCFELSLPEGAANELQGRQATASWEVTSTSESGV